MHRRSGGGGRAVEAVGVDVDCDALRSAATNCALNRLEVQLCLAGGSDPSGAAGQNKDEGGDSSSDCGFPAAEEALRGRQFHVTVANILAPVLMDLAPAIAALTRQGGALALSGILEFQAAAVLGCFAPYFEELRVEDSEGEWVLVTGRRKAAL